MFFSVISGVDEYVSQSGMLAVAQPCGLPQLTASSSALDRLHCLGRQQEPLVLQDIAHVDVPRPNHLSRSPGCRPLGTTTPCSSLGPITISVERCDAGSASSSAFIALVFGSICVKPWTTRHLVVADLGRERRADRQPAHLLRHLLGVVARVRPEDDTAAPPLWRADRALAGAAGALLAPRLATTTADLAARLGVRACRGGRWPAGAPAPGASPAMFGSMPKTRVVELDRARPPRRCSVEHLYLHRSFSLLSPSR